MLKPTISDHEDQRIEEKGNHAACFQERYHTIVLLTKAFFKVPYVSTILEDSEAQSFDNSDVLDAPQINSLKSIYHEIQAKEGICIIEDVLKDSRFKNNPLTMGSQAIRFYASYPLKSIEGQSIGALCIMDITPRSFSDALRLSLENIADIVSVLMQFVDHNVLVNDITKRDVLTQCYNRLYLEYYLNTCIDHVSQGMHYAALMVDFDHFKQINDYYGHMVGDKVLKTFVERLTPLLKQRDMIARIGGDEFMIVLKNITHPKYAAQVAQRILDLTNEPYDIDNESISCKVSIGIVCFPDSASTYADIITSVDLALSKAKKQRNTYAYYSNDLNRIFKYKIELEAKIKDAFESKLFYCVYQPQYDTDKNEIIGAEALLRWQKDVSPKDFISIIEDNFSAEQLNHYVIGAVLNDFRTILQLPRPFKLAINLSMPEIDYEQHIIHLAKLITEAAISPNLTYEFEITENSIFINNPNTNCNMTELAHHLNKYHIELAIDDFGVSQSSLTRLINYHFSTIKIDKSFVDSLVTDQSKPAIAIIKALMSLSQDLDLKIIAEGVETKEQLTILNALGVKTIQGYYFYKPMDAEALNILINKAK